MSMIGRWLHFYPRPPGGGRQRHHIFGGALRKNFYPRPPGGGRPFGRVADTCAGSNFYPRPPGGGRLACIIKDELAIAISIHALRVEGDLWWRVSDSARRISIHALRVEGD